MLLVTSALYIPISNYRLCDSLHYKVRKTGLKLYTTFVTEIVFYSRYKIALHSFALQNRMHRSFSHFSAKKETYYIIILYFSLLAILNALHLLELSSVCVWALPFKTTLFLHLVEF